MQKSPWGQKPCGSQSCPQTKYLSSEWVNMVRVCPASQREINCLIQSTAKFFRESMTNYNTLNSPDPSMLTQWCVGETNEKLPTENESKMCCWPSLCLCHYCCVHHCCLWYSLWAIYWHTIMPSASFYCISSF